MAKPDKSTMKMFALASSIGAVLMSYNNGEPKLIAMRLQIDRAMKVFSRKAGPKLYWAISGQVQEIWTKVAEKHNNTINEEEINAFVEYLCMLAPPDHFKKFLGLRPYKTGTKLSKDVEAGVVQSVLQMDQELNDIFGTKSWTEPVRKPQVVKVKTERDKSKKEVKNEQRVSRGKLLRAASNARKREFFARIRAKRDSQNRKQVDS